MLSFESDYNQGAHPEILRRLCETNFETTSGYGTDKFCDTAKEKIKAACEYQNAEVHFLTGGTQTNAIVIDSLIRPYDGVIAAETGHIATHEAGAIEYTGHKVLTIPQHNGKISPDDLREYLHSFSIDENRSHMVQPGIVYISHPTEYGTLYTKAELTEISEICSLYSIPLYMDGARLGYGLASLDADLTLPDIARLCDAFYIGGTKVGALFGEAIVFTKNAPKNFMTITKQHGALLAKGRLLGIQFDTLFTDGLYFEISKNAIEKSELMKEIFKEKGYSFYMETSTNQQF
ncbi:MAG: aminotransferase class V-fold PLP-dependent enzyme, partial [Clostridia bacterium]|nr:aminotransferase class V-fold PLP-dependent enzyme [Clostridia bacterium]